MEIDYMIKIHIITEVDVKLNKWHIAMEKLYRKPTETKQNLKKNYDPTVGLNHAPKNLAGESFINELAGNSVVLV